VKENCTKKTFKIRFALMLVMLTFSGRKSSAIYLFLMFDLLLSLIGFSARFSRVQKVTVLNRIDFSLWVYWSALILINAWVKSRLNMGMGFRKNLLIFMALINILICFPQIALQFSILFPNFRSDFSQQFFTQ
jgi:hypothetical protein